MKKKEPRLRKLNPLSPEMVQKIIDASEDVIAITCRSCGSRFNVQMDGWCTQCREGAKKAYLSTKKLIFVE